MCTHTNCETLYKHTCMCMWQPAQLSCHSVHTGAECDSAHFLSDRRRGLAIFQEVEVPQSRLWVEFMWSDSGEIVRALTEVGLVRMRR